MLPRFVYNIISHLKLKNSISQYDTSKVYIGAPLRSCPVYTHASEGTEMWGVRYTSALLYGHVLYTHMLVRVQKCEE